jgi:putative chitinase
MRPIEIAKKLCPKARPSYLKAIEQGDALFAKHGITTPLRMAHFLAQAFHETGGLAIEWESGAYSAARLMQIFGVGKHSAGVNEYEAQKLAYKPELIFERVYGLGNPKKSRELGNVQPGDGYRYRGGGILQTTGRYNYRSMGQKCGVDFEAHPELVLSAEHALKPALAEWTAGKLNEKADADDIRAITKRINGGFNGLDDRINWFEKIRPLIDKVELKVSAPPPPDTEPVAPKPKGNVAKNTTSGTVGGGAVVVASQMPDLTTAAIVLGVGLVVAVIVRLVWPKG